jgi:hypothetical protein
MRFPTKGTTYACFATPSAAAFPAAVDVHPTGRGSNFTEAANGPMVIPMACTSLRRPYQE